MWVEIVIINMYSLIKYVYEFEFIQFIEMKWYRYLFLFVEWS